MSSCLQQLPALTESVCPGINGKVGYTGQSGIIAGGSNQCHLAALYQHWYQAHPEAGVAYAGLRCWTLLCWQPALVAVLSVHRLGIVPDLCTIKQVINNGIVFGFELSERETSCRLDALIVRAARQLRQLSEGLLQELTAVTPVKKKLAFRFLADCLMDALIKMYRMEQNPRSEDFQYWAHCWLSAMNQQSDSALMLLPIKGATDGLGLQRKTCCLHYRRCDGELCASCPKQTLAIRKQRLRDEWRAHV